MISGGVIALPSSTPPLITSSGFALAKSRRLLAASTTSPSTNATADGPLSSDASWSSRPASLTAILVRVFLTTANVAWSPSDLRSSASWATVSPRYSVSTAPDESLNRSVSSATAVTFSALAMCLLSVTPIAPLLRCFVASIAPMRRSTFCVLGKSRRQQNAPARGARGGIGSPAGCAVLLSSPARDVRTWDHDPRCGAFGHRDGIRRSSALPSIRPPRHPAKSLSLRVGPGPGATAGADPCGYGGAGVNGLRGPQGTQEGRQGDTQSAGGD